MRSRSYSELASRTTFDDRFDYLELKGQVGAQTFGFDRWINQKFYKSREWQDAREIVIVRDNGCDLGVPGYDIRSEILIHHINPLTMRDIVEGEEWILDPEYLITTTKRTHNAIHYGTSRALPRSYVPRTPGDTKLW